MIATKVAAAIVAVMLLVILESIARGLYVHYTEFEPAHEEWNDAFKRKDLDGMMVAFNKELRAAKRTELDPFWFIRPPEWK